MSESKKPRGEGRELSSGHEAVYNVNKLSRELLIRVFGWLPFHQRHETIPLVCRKWAELTLVPCKSCVLLHLSTLHCVNQHIWQSVSDCLTFPYLALAGPLWEHPCIGK